MIGFYVFVGFTIVSWLLFWARIDRLKAQLDDANAWAERCYAEHVKADRRSRELEARIESAPKGGSR